MIQIESVYIEEVRGIRELILNMGRKNFVISGPNGSGKSGVVDAIEFCLTGEISRLTGKGTGDLKLATHGPHVDKRDYPDSSFVRLKLYLPNLGKSVTVTRKIKSPKKVQIKPDDDEVEGGSHKVAQHPEITLSRREIIRFILTEATQRSRDVQTLLRLDEIDQTRSTLKTTLNKLLSAQSAADTQVSTARDALERHLDVPALTPEGLLAGVNKRRRVLRLSEIARLEEDTSVSEGISEGAKKAGPNSKESTLRDLEALRDSVEGGLGKRSESEVFGVLRNLKRIEEDPGLLDAIRRRSFIQTGLDLIDTANCPLCDTGWEVDELRAHLQEKLERSDDAEELQEALLRSGREIAKEVAALRGLIEPVEKIATAEGATAFATTLGVWSAGLTNLSENLSSVTGLVSVKSRFEAGWTAAPSALLANTGAVIETVKRPAR